MWCSATGVIGIVCVIPWIIFNVVFQKINNETFPFSTLALLLAILFAVCGVGMSDRSGVSIVAVADQPCL